MKRSLYWLVFALPVLLLTVLPARAQDSLPRFEASDCSFSIPTHPPVKCGFVLVPEDRSQADSPTIKLPVAVFTSQSPNRQPDPIIYLAGGPGGNTMDSVPDWYQTFAGFIQSDRDFILFDQRGVGLAQPSLDCPEYYQMELQQLPLNPTDAEASKLYNEALTTCYQRLVKSGIDMNAYNSAANAADVADLVKALGYDRVNLLGISYGTRLALTIMRDYPESVRSVILDSVIPPNVNGVTGDIYARDRVFETLFNNCASDAACNKAYPNLKDTLLNTARKLDQTPVMLHVTIPPETTAREALLNGESFVGLVYQLFYISPIIPQIPQIIADGSRGNFDYLSFIAGYLLEDSLSEGVFYEYNCQEDYAFTNLDAIKAEAQKYPTLGEYLTSKNFVVEGDAFSLCKTYFTGKPDPSVEQPVTSDIPTLVMSAEYDPVTPPIYGEEAAKTLTNSHYFLYPGLGHGVTPADECPLSMALAFVENPNQQPDDSCIARMSEPAWVVPTPVGEISMKPYSNKTLGISSVAPSGWTEAADGVFVFSADNAASMAFRQPEDGLQGYFNRIIIQNYGYAQVPAPKTTIDSDAGSWTIYQVEGQGVYTSFATIEIGGKAYVIGVVAATADERDSFYQDILLPAVKAFKVDSAAI